MTAPNTFFIDFSGNSMSITSGQSNNTILINGVSIYPLTGYTSGLLVSSNSINANTTVDISLGSCTDSNGSIYITLGSPISKDTGGTWVAGTGHGLGPGVTLSPTTTYYIFIIQTNGSTDVYFDSANTATHQPANTSAHQLIGSFITDGSSHISHVSPVGAFDFSTRNLTVTGNASFGVSGLSGSCIIGNPGSGLGGDIFTNRGNGTGVVYLGDLSHYLQWDGANYNAGGWGALAYQGWVNANFTTYGYVEGNYVNSVRFVFAGDISFGVAGTWVSEINPAVMTGIGFDTSGNELARYRYLQILIPLAGWLTVGWAS